MKRSTKICLIVCACLFGTGVACSIAGAATGGKLSDVEYYVRRGDFNIGSRWFWGNNGYHLLDKLDRFDWFDFDDDGDSISDINYNHNMDLDEKFDRKSELTDTYAHTYEYTNISKLDIDMSAALFKLQEYDGDSFIVATEIDDNKFQCKDEGSKLSIKYNKKYLQNEKYMIVLFVPQGTIFDEVELDLGAGRVKVDRLEADKVNLSVAAGEIQVNEELIAKKGKFEVAAGSLVLDNFQVDEMDIETQAGSFTGTGNITSKCNVEVLAGSVALNLVGKETDFNYDIEKSAGSVVINQTDYTGIYQDKNMNNNASKKIDIECSAGSIEILF